MADKADHSTSQRQRTLALPDLMAAKPGERHAIREALAGQVVDRYRRTLEYASKQTKAERAAAQKKARLARRKLSSGAFMTAYLEVLRHPHVVTTEMLKRVTHHAPLNVDEAAATRAIKRLPGERERWRRSFGWMNSRVKRKAVLALLRETVTLLQVLDYGPGEIGIKLGITTRRVQQIRPRNNAKRAGKQSD